MNALDALEKEAAAEMERLADDAKRQRLRQTPTRISRRRSPAVC